MNKPEGQERSVAPITRLRRSQFPLHAGNVARRRLTAVSSCVNYHDAIYGSSCVCLAEWWQKPGNAQPIGNPAVMP